MKKIFYLSKDFTYQPIVCLNRLNKRGTRKFAHWIFQKTQIKSKLKTHHWKLYSAITYNYLPLTVKLSYVSSNFMQGICLTAYHTQVDACISPERITWIFNDDCFKNNYFLKKKKFTHTCRYINLPMWTLTVKFAHPTRQAATADQFLTHYIRVFPGYLLIYTFVHVWYSKYRVHTSDLISNYTDYIMVSLIVYREHKHNVFLSLSPTSRTIWKEI